MAIRYPIVFKTDTKGLDKAESSLKKFGGVAAKVAGAATAAVGTIATVSVKAFADFDSALNKSLSIMGDVSAALEKDMSDAAREVAKTTSFSAEEAAESFFFLASAGLDATQSVAAMPQVAAFAQAGMFDMATATDLATDAQSALGLTSEDTEENLENLTRVTDVFVKANTLANTSVEQLAAAMTSKAGNALKTVSKDIEEGSATLAVFADQGIKGERAGTLLTNTLFGLTENAEKNSGAFKALGIEVFDADGAMRNMADISDDVTNAFTGMSEEQKLAEISQLGFTKQTREGVLALAGQGDTLREYEEALRNAGGTAQEVAEKQLDTLNAQFGLLKDSAMDVGLEIGGVLAPHIQTVVEAAIPFVQDLAPAFGDGLRNIESAAQGAFGRLEGIVSVFQGIGEHGDVGDQIDFVADQFGLLGDNIIENLGSAFTKFMAFRQQLTEAILEALPGIIDGVLTFIPQLITFLAEEVLPMVFNQLVGIVDQLITIFEAAFPKIVFAFQEIIPLLISAITQFIPKIVQTLIGLIPTLLQGALQLFTGLMTALQQTAPKLIAMIVEMIPQLIETIVGMLPSIIEAGLELFSGIITAFTDSFVLLLDMFIEVFPQLLEAVIGALPQIIDAGLTLFFGIVTALVDSIPEIVSAIVDMIPELTTTLVDALPDIIEASMELFFGIIEGLIDAIPDILEAVIGMIPEITGALLGELPKLIEAGFNILQGIAEGILTNLPQVASNLASSIGSAITNTVKNWFGISSPSKVFMGIGEELMAGLQTGIEDSKDLAVGASVNMASNVKLATEQAFGTVGSGSIVTPMGFSESSSMASSAPANIQITINAGAGSDPVATGRAVVDAIKRYERVNGKVFATA